MKRLRTNTSILQSILAKAAESDLTEEAICEKLKISPSRFSRWKNGLLAPPDPRIDKNRQFYKELAGFLDRPLGEVLVEVFFVDQSIERELAKDIRESMGADLLDPCLPKFSRKSAEKLKLLLINISGHAEFLDPLLAGLRTYIQAVKKEEWCQSPVGAVSRMNKQVSEKSTLPTKRRN